MIFLPTLLKAIGGGLGIAGMLQGANSEEFATDLNYRIDRANAGTTRQNALTGLRLQSAGDAIQFDAAKANFQLAKLDAEAGQRNADRLRLFAESSTKQGREAIRRQFRSFDEFQGSQRTAVAASGVQMSGSALEVMAESEARFRTTIQDMQDEANYARSATLDEAAMSEFGARNAMIGAQSDLGFARRGRVLSRTANRIGRGAVRSQYRSNLLSAEMARLSGQDSVAGQRASAVGSVLSGAGGYAADMYQRNQLGM
jgi:hypothetical protein